jgi:hypothetical protein
LIFGVYEKLPAVNNVRKSTKAKQFILLKNKIKILIVVHQKI